MNAALCCLLEQKEISLLSVSSQPSCLSLLTEARLEFPVTFPPPGGTAQLVVSPRKTSQTLKPCEGLVCVGVGGGPGSVSGVSTLYSLSPFPPSLHFSMIFRPYSISPQPYVP